MHVKPKQQGVILLTLVLIILAAGSFVLLKALNVAAMKREVNEDAVTYAALKQAKRLLIGYAVNFPAMTNASSPAEMRGPGRLPCPDLIGNGTSIGTCSLGGANSMTGRFPFREINSDKIVDGSGSDLWYSLDEAYRYHLSSSVINSDAPASGALQVDSDSDIVAVIIAPGYELESQDRPAGAGIGDYLEGENATLSDVIFSSVETGLPFNDTVITITRSELMAAVEQRVLAEVQNSLNEFHRLNGGFPWPSAFESPNDSPFDASIGITEGHLAIHDAEESFTANFSFKWNIEEPNGVIAGDFSPDNTCLRSNECTQEYDAVTYTTDQAEVAFSGFCNWTNAEEFDCQGSSTVMIPAEDDAASNPPVERKYDVDLHLVNQATTIPLPAGPNGRVRGFTLNGKLSSDDEVSIEVRDEIDDNPRNAGTINLGADDEVTVTVSNVPFLIGNDQNIVQNVAHSPASLPRWFTDNYWHHFVYFAFAPDESAGGPGCTAGSDCLTVRWIRDTDTHEKILNNARGVVLTTGADLDLSSFRTPPPPPPVDLGEYLEGENNNSDAIFVKEGVSISTNDQLRILDPFSPQ